MEHNEGPVAPTQAVAGRVREVRDRRRMSAARLADEMTRVGIRWDRNTVAKLETGRRANVSVAELLALAVVLDVAPVHLLVPPDAWDDEGGEQLYQITPTRAEPASTVRAWVRGMPLPGSDLRNFVSQVPEHELRVLLERVAEQDTKEE